MHINLCWPHNLADCIFETMQVIPLSEGTFTVDKTKHFVPFNEQEHDLQNRPPGSLLVEVQPFVIVGEKDILLLDTGLGFAKNNELQLHHNLKAHGIDPSAVTKVLLTHLHKDHAGGVARQSSTPSWELSFPRATYYLQESELNFAFQKGFPSFVSDELQVLQHSPQVVLLEQDNGIIDDYISYEVTHAHSPFHQVFRIQGETEIIFFGGDDAPQLQQMKHRFIAKYDYDGKRAMELRRTWWELGHREKWTFLFYHDVKNPIHQY